MKKFKLGIVVLLMAAFTGIANAGGVGYIDYGKRPGYRRTTTAQASIRL